MCPDLNGVDARALKCIVHPVDKKGVDFPMFEEALRITRYISSLDRLLHIFYDRGLSPQGIGWGQQYFLHYIHRYPGITPQALTLEMQVDKGTTTKALQRLCKKEYLHVTVDEQDRRVHHLYVTDAALPVIQRIGALHQEVKETLMDGFTEEESRQLEHQLEKMTRNVAVRLGFLERRELD